MTNLNFWTKHYEFTHLHQIKEQNSPKMEQNFNLKRNI